MSQPIANPSILITGASRGLGRALALALAREGARLSLVARDPAPLEAVARAIREAGGEAIAIGADVSDKSRVHAIVGQAAAAMGPVDILINNASTLGPLPMPFLLDTECEDLASVLEVNLLAPFRLTKAVAGSMILRGRGLIVNLSSDAAVSPYPGWGAYGVSKAALDHLTRIWAEELRATGLRVISIDPGEMDTRMHADAMPEADRASLRRPEEVASRIVGLLRTAESGARIAL